MEPHWKISVNALLGFTDCWWYQKNKIKQNTTDCILRGAYYISIRWSQLMINTSFLTIYWAIGGLVQIYEGTHLKHQKQSCVGRKVSICINYGLLRKQIGWQMQSSELSQKLTSRVLQKISKCVLNSLRPSNAYMHRRSYPHWLR